MKMLKRFLLIYLTLTSIQIKANCLEVTKACSTLIKTSDAYILELKKENEMQAELLKQQDSSIAQLQALTASMDKELNSFHRDPANMVLIGLFVGLATGIAIAK